VAASACFFFLLLGKKKKKMCFSAPVSLASFLVGMLVAISVGIAALKMHQTSLALLALGWTWVIAMQWWEFMVWRQWETAFASQMAYLFNILQIPVLFFIFASDAPFLVRTLASVLLILYLGVMLTPLPTEDMRVHHGHMDYSWWTSPLRISTYFIGLVAIFLLLVRPLRWSVACIVSLLLLCLLSRWLYPSENVASLWCFFAVFFPVLAMLLRWWLPS